MANAKLIVLSDPMRGQSYELTAPSYSIGRVEEMDITLADATVSTHHCDLTRNDDESYTVNDLGSTNGTRINGTRIDQQTLINSDILQVGEIEILYDCDGGEAATSEVGTITKIDIIADSGGISSQPIANLNPYQKKRKQDNPATKFVMIGIISVMVLVVLFLGFKLAKNMF